MFSSFGLRYVFLTHFTPTCVCHGLNLHRITHCVPLTLTHLSFEQTRCKKYISEVTNLELKVIHVACHMHVLFVSSTRGRLREQNKHGDVGGFCNNVLIFKTVLLVVQRQQPEMRIS